MKPTVTISIEEYDNLRNVAKSCSSQIAAAKAETEAEKNKDHSQEAENFRGMLLRAILVIQFAVGNLDPTTVRGWPWQDLMLFAISLRDAPGIPFEFKEMTYDLEHFCNECKKIEEDRVRAYVSASK